MAVKFEEATLANGLKVIAEVDPHAHSAAVGYFVKTGARDEDTRVMGVSHFLEHMMFKGTPTRSTDDINQAFDRLGAKNNAYTSAEMTCFHATVLPEYLLGTGGVNEVLADMMRPALRQEDFDTEKKVILEEIAMYQDNPFWVLYERTMELHCGASAPKEAFVGPTSESDIRGMHPLGHRVLGTSQSITDLTSAQMRQYFEARYSPDNTVVSLAGKVNFDQTVREIERFCGHWKRTGARREQAAPKAHDARIEIRDKKVNRGYCLMLTPAPSAQDERRYPASLLAQVLGGSDNSRLHWALIETGLAEDAECAYDPRDGCGDFLVYVSADPERLDEVWGVVSKEIDALGESITEEDLEKIRCKMATGVTLAGERPGGRMQRLGRQWTSLGRYSTLEEELEKINRVRASDVKELLRTYAFSPRTVGRLLPEG